MNIQTLGELKEIEPTTKQLNSMLAEFGVKTEDKLQIKLMKSWHIVRCGNCGKKISLLACSWNDFYEPIHRYGRCGND